MRLEHHLVGGYVRYISPHIIIIITCGPIIRFHFSSRRVKYYRDLTINILPSQVLVVTFRVKPSSH